MTDLEMIDADIARIEAECAALDDRIARRIAVLDVVHGVPAADLRAMKLDRAELRWDAACGYLDALREESSRGLRRRLILGIAGQYALQSADNRGTVVGCDFCTKSECRQHQGWIGRLDVFDAIARIKRVFGDGAARYVAELLIPPSLRDET